MSLKALYKGLAHTTESASIGFLGAQLGNV